MGGAGGGEPFAPADVYDRLVTIVPRDVSWMRVKRPRRAAVFVQLERDAARSSGFAASQPRSRCRARAGNATVPEASSAPQATEPDTAGEMRVVAPAFSSRRSSDASVFLNDTG
jgi:hypothetical protein